MGIDIVGLGDSLTYGYPYGTKESWLTLASRAAGLKAANKGVNGDTAADMLRRFAKDVLELKPKAVVIQCGTNDAWARIEVREVKAKLMEMIARAKGAGIVPVIALPPPPCPREGDTIRGLLSEMKKLLEVYRKAYRELVDEHKLFLLDFHTPLVNGQTGWGKPEYFVDDVHPNREGYRIMASEALTLFYQLKEINQNWNKG